MAISRALYAILKQGEKMKYIVNTQGKVYEYKQVAYSVNAETKEEAERIALQRFHDDYIVADDEFCASASGVKMRVIAALAGLSVACILALIGFRSGTTRNPVTIRPDFASILYAAGIYLILLFKFKGVKNVLSMKEISESFKDWKDIVMALLMILLIASFIQLLFSQMKIGFKFLSFNMDLRLLALGLALIAYFSSGLLSLICFVLFCLLSRMSISGLSAVLGNVQGILFLTASLVGIVAFISSKSSLYQGILNVKAFFNNPAKKLRAQQAQGQDTPEAL